MKRALVVLALAAAATAAAIFANVALLGYAESRNDPVGKLSPRLSTPAPVRRAASPPRAAPRTVPGPRVEGADD